MTSPRARLLLATALAGLVLSTVPTSQAFAAGPSLVTGPLTGAGSTSGYTLLNPGAGFDFYGGSTLVGTLHGGLALATYVGVEMHGSDLIGSWAVGAGPMSVSISGFSSQPGSFVRVGAVEVMTAYTASGGVTPTFVDLTALCGWLPVETPPDEITDYTMACAMTLGSDH